MVSGHYSFPSDHDQDLKDLQKAAYPDVLHTWQVEVLAKLHEAERVTGWSEVGFVFRRRAWLGPRFKLETAQPIHDRIASLYRYIQLQPRLDEPAGRTTQERANQWFWFAGATFRELLSKNPDFTHSYLVSHAYDDSERGADAMWKCHSYFDEFALTRHSGSSAAPRVWSAPSLGASVRASLCDSYLQRSDVQEYLLASARGIEDFEADILLVIEYAVGPAVDQVLHRRLISWRTNGSIPVHHQLLASRRRRDLEGGRHRATSCGRGRDQERRGHARKL